MSESLMILQASTRDLGGGAEQVAWALFNAYRERNLASWLAVGKKFSADPNVFEIPNHLRERTRWVSFWLNFQRNIERKSFRGATRLARAAAEIAEPRRTLERRMGLEDFNFPGTRHLLDLTPQRPNLLHLHNLHGGYFDLRELPGLSRRLPLILNLHDSWLVTGHCGHPINCDRWQTGCGHCPDLTIYPAVQRDNTAYNWRRKQAIYAHSKLYLMTPSQWLMDRVEQSILAPAIRQKIVIPYGVDDTIFHPADKQAIRQQLDLPSDVDLLLFVGNLEVKNPFKDPRTLREALARLAPRRRTILLVLGAAAETEILPNGVEIAYRGFIQDRHTVARYYQAADLYLHAAFVDTFPNTVLEALASGLAVIATAVAGIPEQVKSLRPCHSHAIYSEDEATGILVPGQDAGAMAHALEVLLAHEDLRAALGANAVRDAHLRFDRNTFIQRNLDWYELIREDHAAPGKR